MPIMRAASSYLPCYMAFNLGELFSVFWLPTVSSPYCKLGLKRDAYGKYIPSCTYCYWESNKAFSAKGKAEWWFKRHKHDDPATYSSAMQKAIHNLRDAALIT